MMSEQYRADCLGDIVGGILKDDNGTKRIIQTGLKPEMLPNGFRELYAAAVEMDSAGMDTKGARKALVARAMAISGQLDGTHLDNLIDKYIQYHASATDTEPAARSLCTEYLQGIAQTDMVEAIMTASNPDQIREAMERFRVSVDKATARTGLPAAADIRTMTGDRAVPMRPELIEGVLRVGHIAVLTGASKVSKSFALINLALATVSGTEWFGHTLRAGNVLYVNMEIDPASFAHRVQNVADARRIDLAATEGNLLVQNLRGEGATLATVADDIIRSHSASDLSLVVLDPIYKLMDGDENSAGDVGAMFNQFDRIAAKTGAAVIVCHHHSKGAQAGKSSMERGSGSGVFSRSPDCLIDLLEVEVTEETKDQLAEHEPDLNLDHVVGLELGYTLREFPPQPVRHGFFVYPQHIPDQWGLLKDSRTATEARAADTRRRNAKASNAVQWESVLGKAWENLTASHPDHERIGISYNDIRMEAERIAGREFTDGTMTKKLRESGFTVRNSRVVPKQENWE